MRNLQESAGAGPVIGTHLVEQLAARANDWAGKTAYIFLGDGVTETGRLSFAELDLSARTIAARLQAMGLGGERALLLYPPGLDYIAAFFGCLYAGVVAVPAYPPTRRQGRRLLAIIADAEPALVLSTAALTAKFQDDAEYGARPWLATDTLDAPSLWQPPTITADSLAFLQYTSGSTGDPKGVMVSHGNLMANQAAIQQGFEHGEDTCVVGWLPLYHDMGLIGNILQPLYLGASAILMPPMAFLEQPIRWLRAIAKYRATTSGGPNFAYDLCARKVTEDQKRGLDLSTWRVAFNGSEPVRTATLERFAAAFAECGFRRDSFFPCYGLAEATLFVTGEHWTDSTPASDGPGTPPPVACGIPQGHHGVRIVEPASRRLCPEGREGEIWVAGPSVTQGYWNRPELSAATFQAQLAEAPVPTRFLRTGDLGIWDRGRLYVTGRIKDLLIIRGRNVYPQDIEHALTDRVAALNPSGCVAFAGMDEAGESLIVVAELSRDALRDSDYPGIFAELRAVLAEECELSAAEWVLVRPGSVPKTSSGKPRRQACKQAYVAQSLPVLARSGDEAETAEAPSAGLEQAPESRWLRAALAALPPGQRAPLLTQFLTARLARLLGTLESRLDSATPLRMLGLDSLKALELKHAADQLLGGDAPLSLFLADHSLAEVAARLAEQAPSPQDRDETTASDAGLSATQLAMWTVQHLEPASLVYNLHLAVRITPGDHDPDRWRQACEHLAQRHASLRTTYHAEENGLVARLAAAAPSGLLVGVEAQGWSESALRDDMARRVREPFDLAQGPLFRAVFYRNTTHDSDSLLLCAHHIALDLWSVLMLVEELGIIHAALVRGQVPALSPPTAQPADVVAWQRRYLDSPTAAQDRDYWQQQLAGELPVLALPTDYPRPAALDYRGASVAVRLEGAITERLQRLAIRYGVTLSTLLLALYKVLLYRQTRQQELVVGVPTSGRSQARFTGMVGNFVNPVPLRTRPAGAFSSYLGQVHSTLLDALAHQDYPFALMLDDLSGERHADHWPVYQTLFVFQRAQTGIDPRLAQLALGEDGNALPWAGANLQALGIQPRVERFDLKLMAAEVADELWLSFQYRPDLFAAATIRRMVGHFQTLLAGVLDHPELALDRLPLVGREERAWLLRQARGPATTNAATTYVHRLFEAHAARTPDAPAVADCHTCLSHRQLNRLANYWAGRLLALGVAPGDRVGICVERSVDFVVAILAALKAGAAYVPLDPSFPPERIAAMLADAGAALGLVHRSLPPEALPGLIRLDMDGMRPELADDIANLRRDPAPDSPAYVIYTSGSTGQSKGVVVSQRSLANYARHMVEQLDAGPGWHYGLVSTPAADLGNTAIFAALTSGGCLHVFDRDASTDGRVLAAAMARQPIDVLKIVPAHLTALLDSAEEQTILPRRALVCGGDVLDYALVERVAALNPACRIVNHYGPTETTVGALVFPVTARPDTPRSAVPIGRPIAHLQAHILDAEFEPVPVGIAGELYLGGVGLAQGYWHRADLTAERFLPDPFGAPGTRLYRTGDLARRHAEGWIEFLGRADQQLKIRGYRIEPGEIEARLKTHPEVRDAVVAAWEDVPGNKRLAAYVVPVQTAPDPEALRAYLHNTLPDYMLPSAFVCLDALPLTANGKPDRKALPIPDPASQPTRPYAAPRTPAEAQLATLWAEVLRLERVGIHDNFFALGGDSILSIQVASRARRLGLNLAPRQIFQHQTVAELAPLVDIAVRFEAEQGPLSGPLPLTPVQCRFLAQGFANPHHWNQSLWLELRQAFAPDALARALEQLVQYHDILRVRFTQNPDSGAWQAHYAATEPQALFHREDLSPCAAADLDSQLAARVAAWQRRLDLGTGPLLQAVWFELGPERRPRLLLVIHHLAMDIASWRILLDDLVAAHQQVLAEQPLAWPAKTTSYRQWAQHSAAHAASLVENLPATWDAWKAPWPVDDPDGSNTEADATVYTTTLSEPLTRTLIQDAGAAYRTSVQELLLIAVAWGLAEWSGSQRLRLEVEAHSRDSGPFHDLDFTRTLGRFTTAYPVTLDLGAEHSPRHLLQTLKEQFRQQAERGFDYTVWRWLGAGRALGTQADAPVLFNYLGHLDLGTDAHAYFRACELAPGVTHDPHNQRTHELAVTASIREGGLRLAWTYSAARYQTATLARLGAVVTQALETLIQHCRTPDAGGLMPSDVPLATWSVEELQRLPYPPRAIEDLYPLGPMQEGMLFYALLYPGSGIYHMLDRYEVDGEVDIPAFRAAWQEVLDRHPILRTSFLWRDHSSPHQCVHKQVALPFDYQDWEGLPAAEQEQRFAALIEEELRTGFDFTVPPLMRIRLVRFAERRYRFVRSHHHILMDAWCKSPVLLEFRAHYEARVKGLDFPPREAAIPYRDYIGWLVKQDVRAAEDFWRNYLAGLGEPTPLVVDRPVPPDAGARSEVRDLVTQLSETDTQALQTLSQRFQLTPNTFLQAAWALMLAHYARSHEVLFGVTVAGRPTDLPGVETALGLFINSLPLRVQVRPDQPVLDFLRGLLYHNLELRQYEYFPLVRIQALSGLARGQALFQHLFVFENAPVDPTLRGEREVLNIVGDQHRTHSNYPLNAVLVPGPEFHLQITYDVHRFEAGVVERMLGHFRTLLEQLIRRPEARLGAVPMLTSAEQRLILDDWNQTQHRYPEPLDIVACFAAQAARAPEALAVACGDQSLSYRALETRVNRLAHALRAEGVGPETLVAILSDRGVDFLVMMLGLFTAGGAYLPLDPAHPDPRLVNILKEARVERLLVSAAYQARAETLAAARPLQILALPELAARPLPSLAPPRRHGPGNLAFTIFTSGSTGTPKGAMVEHRGMFNNLITKLPTLGLGPNDVIAQTAGQCFDISVWQHLTALACGGRVEIFPDDVVRDPAQLLGQLAARGVTILEAVPSMIQALLELAGDIALPKLRWLIACGEVFPPELCRRWMERFPGVRVLNAYGPAECSDDVSYYEARTLPAVTDTLVPIGRPADNTRLYLLDAWLSPVPVGVPGEICVAGIQVGRGYLYRPELTAEKFIPDPFDSQGGRLYRTGDLGRYREDGTLEFLGRIDHQVKIRGVRIEPGEVEAQLLAHPAVEQAVVIARDDVGAGGKQLVAYLVLVPVAPSEADTLAGELRLYLSARLPAYLVPAAFVLLTELPLSPNGKLDRKALPAPELAHRRHAETVAPRTPIEQALVEIWREVLGLERVGVADNFFDLGGHSLIAVQVLSRVRAAFAVDVPLRRVFDAATIAELALVIEDCLIEQLDSLSEEDALALLENAS